jgi:hypothetical protein
MKKYRSWCIVLMVITAMHDCVYGAAGEVAKVSGPKLTESASKPQVPSVQQKAQISTIEASGFEIATKTDAVTGKQVGSKVTRPDGTKRIVNYNSEKDTTLHLEFDASGKATQGKTVPGRSFDLGKVQVGNSLDLSSDQLAKIAPPKPVRSKTTTVPKEARTDLTLTTNEIGEQGSKILTDDISQDVPMPNNKLAKAKIESNKSYDKAKEEIEAFVAEQVQDPKLFAEIKKSPEYKKAKSTIADKLAHNYNETMNFLSSIQWSKLSPSKTIAKTASSSARQINNFFKDLSIAAKKSMPDVQLSKEEQQFQARGQAVQIGRIGKKINQAEKIMQENEESLKTAQDQLKIEQSKNLQEPLWIKKYKDDIAYLQNQIAGRKNMIENLKSEQTQLMGNTFNQYGHLLQAPVTTEQI